MPKITKPDLHWLQKLYDLAFDLWEGYPEILSDEDEEIIEIAGEILTRIKGETE